MPENNNGITRSELITLERDALHRSSITLEKYVDIRFEALVRETKLALEAGEHRLNLLQELRTTVEQTIKNMVAQGFCLATHKALQEDLGRIREAIRQLELSKAALDGKASRTAVLFSQALAFLGLVVAVIALVSR